MSKTNKGGTRLRLVVGVAATTAVMAGILAAYAHSKPLLASCSLPAVVKGASPVQLSCSGLSANTTYYIYPGTMGEWNDSTTSGSGSQASPFTFNGGSVAITTNGSGAITGANTYFATESSGSVQANANLTVYTNPAPSGAVVTSSNMDIIRPVFTYTPSSSIVGGGVVQIQVSGLISGKDYQLKPEVSGTVSTAGWDVSNSNDGSTSGLAGAFKYADGNLFGSGNSSPYMINSSGSCSIYMQTVTPASDVTPIRFRLVDASSTLEVDTSTSNFTILNH